MASPPAQNPDPGRTPPASKVRPLVTRPLVDPTRPLLLDFLADHDASCPVCGYNLRGISTPRCPECGRTVHFEVVPAESHLRAWVALAATTCSAAGLGLYLVADSLGGPMPHWATWFSFAWFGANVLLAPIILAGRKAFSGLDKSTQNWAVVASAMISVGAFVLLAIPWR